MTHHTYLEQLSCLCLHTLGSIDHHHGRIRRHQCTVRILRKILMARRIQDIDAEAVVIKLQHRGSNRNTSLFFDLHPVRNGVARGSFSLHRSSQIDRSSIEQKFLCQCSFSRIRVRNNRKGSTFFYFTCYISHDNSSINLFTILFFSHKLQPSAILTSTADSVNKGKRFPGENMDAWQQKKRAAYLRRALVCVYSPCCMVVMTIFSPEISVFRFTISSI